MQLLNNVIVGSVWCFSSTETITKCGSGVDENKLVFARMTTTLTTNLGNYSYGWEMVDGYLDVTLMML